MTARVIGAAITSQRSNGPHIIPQTTALRSLHANCLTKLARVLAASDMTCPKKAEAVLF